MTGCPELGAYRRRVTADAPAAYGTEVHSIASLPLAPAARAAVPAMFGYRMPPMPGVHRGLPSPYLTLVFSLSGAIPIETAFRFILAIACWART